jgi:hypothetical protein
MSCVSGCSTRTRREYENIVPSLRRTIRLSMVKGPTIACRSNSSTPVQDLWLRLAPCGKGVGVQGSTNQCKDSNIDWPDKALSAGL